mgnify:CR=1 FL=1
MKSSKREQKEAPVVPSSHDTTLMEATLRAVVPSEAVEVPTVVFTDEKRRADEKFVFTDTPINPTVIPSLPSFSEHPVTPDTLSSAAPGNTAASSGHYAWSFIDGVAKDQVLSNTTVRERMKEHFKRAELKDADYVKFLKSGDSIKEGYFLFGLDVNNLAKHEKAQKEMRDQVKKVNKIEVEQLMDSHSFPTRL